MPLFLADETQIRTAYHQAIAELKAPQATEEIEELRTRPHRDYDAELAYWLDRTERAVEARSHVFGEEQSPISSKLREELRAALDRSRALASGAMAEGRANMKALEARTEFIIQQLEAEERERVGAVVTGILTMYGVPAPASHRAGQSAGSKVSPSTTGTRGMAAEDVVASKTVAAHQSDEPSIKGRSASPPATQARTPLAAQSAGDMSGAREESGELSYADMRRRDETRLKMDSLPDGAIGPVVGSEYAANGTRPIHMMLGVNTTTGDTFNSALKLAELSGRPVVPILNHTSRQEAQRFLDDYERAWNELPAWQKALVEPVHLSSRPVAAPLAIGNDAARAVHDRLSDPEKAFEPSVQSMRQHVLTKLLSGEQVDIDAHSQGTVNAKAGAQLIERDLSALEQSGSISGDERRAALSRLHIYATGAFASPENWPQGVRVTAINDRRDLISVLGGWHPPNRGMGLKAHGHDENYLPQVAEDARVAPPQETRKTKRESRGASGRW